MSKDPRNLPPSPPLERAPAQRNPAKAEPAMRAAERGAERAAPAAKAEPAPEKGTLGKITTAKKSAAEIAAEGRARKTPARPGGKRPAPPPPATQDAAQAAIARWSAARPMTIGMIAVVALVGGFGIWGGTSTISGAVVSPGQIEVEAQRQVIQHPDGGVVGEILVKDGDRVEAGDVLVRLDDKLLRSELNIIEGQLFEIMARRARLSAERDGVGEIAFDAELMRLAETRPEVQELMEGQQRLFEARRDTRDRETAQLRERQQQTERQIEGIESQNEAMRLQLELIREELADKQTLRDRELIPASEVLRLMRDVARLEGQVGEFIASTAQARGRIAEIEIEIVKLQTRMREEAISTLRDLEYREVELRERRLTTLEKLSRLEIRTPMNGIVYGNTVFALRSVIRPADPVMYVVPVDSNLVITTRVEPINIDEVHVGQAATLRFSAFNMRDTPELEGTVTQVSADAFVDEARGYSYFTARVTPLPGELEKLSERELLPGMPVEAYIKTGERTALNYIVRPFMDYFMKAFREE